MKNMIIGVLIALIAIMIISCGTKTGTTTEIEETVVVETSDMGTSVEVTSGSADVTVDVSSDAVSVDVSSDTVSVDLNQNNEESQSSDQSTETIEVKIEDYAFEEKTLTIKAGTTVVWENYDSAPHTVTGDGLDSGKMSKGDTYEYTFTEPGTYEYYCAYHPSMTGTVIVE